MKPLRVLLLTEEDKLYLPAAIAHVLKHCRHDIFHVCCLRNPTTESFSITLGRFFRAYGLTPLFGYARLLIPVLMNKIAGLGTAEQFSVKATVTRSGCAYSYVEDVNRDDFVNWVSEQAPDLIATISPTQILGARLLAIPRLGCINVHSSYLPLHRGLYPVYWTMASGDEDIGVSIHYLDEGIDTGDIIMQSGFSLENVRTMHEALKKAKQLGASLMVEAIDKLAHGTVDSIRPDVGQGSYHSFPDKNSYIAFRRHGYRLW